MDILGVLDPDPHENLCGSETLLQIHYRPWGVCSSGSETEVTYCTVYTKVPPGYSEAPAKLEDPYFFKFVKEKNIRNYTRSVEPLIQHKTKLSIFSFFIF